MQNWQPKLKPKKQLEGKTHLFHLLFFTCNLCKKSLHHTAPSCLWFSTSPKVPAAAQVSTDPSHKPTTPQNTVQGRKTDPQKNHLLQQKKTTGKSQWIEKWQRRCETNSKVKQMEAMKWSRRVKFLPSRLHKREKRREKTQADGLGYELIKKVSHSQVVN